MRSKKHWLEMLAVMFAAQLTGCAANSPPPQFAEGITWVAAKHQVRDAKSQRVSHWPCLRVDRALEMELDAAMTEPELGKARALAFGFIDEAHRLSLQSTNNELLRLNDDGWRELMRLYFNDVEVDLSADLKQQITDAFKHRTDLQVWFLRRQVEQANDVDALRKALRPIKERIEPSVKTADRSGQVAVLAFFALPASLAREAIHSNEGTCQMDEDFDAIVRYEPADPVAVPAEKVALPHWDLLVKHAPVFVQEHPKQIAYPRSADGIGFVVAADDASIDVDVARPAVYAYARKVLIAGDPHIQLTYAIWYPQRPQLNGPIDAEAGRIDGATIRITLDSRSRPAIFETLNNCGCHHRLYPTQSLESAARQQHGEPLKDKLLALERDIDGKYDLIIPKALKLDGEASRPIVRCRAGTHAVVDVDVTEGHAGESVVETRGYTLLPYDELEQLRTPSGKIVSMFLDNGLVRGAERLESTLFNPLGMLNAGQPRQRGTQMIQWDQFDFDHPKLLESTLRLPRQF